MEDIADELLGKVLAGVKKLSVGRCGHAASWLCAS